MKKLIPLLISGVLVVGAVGCERPASRTTTEAPSNTTENATPPSKEAAQTTQKDGQGDVRTAQVESDIRSREQRNNITGGDDNRDPADLESQVRGKLEKNIPAGSLTVKADEAGAVTVSGTVPTQEQLNKIPTLAKEIKGVKSVKNEVKVAPAKAGEDNKKAQ